MSEIADFLRARYTEARKREEGVRRIKCPGPFDGHDVTLDSDGRVLIDDHEYPADKYWELASEPGADPSVLADLDAKLFMLAGCERALAASEADPAAPASAGARDVVHHLLRYFAAPFVGHPDHKGEEWAP